MSEQKRKQEGRDKRQKEAGKVIGDPGMQAKGKEAAGHTEKPGEALGKAGHKKPGQHKAHGRH
jgi:hypothetical protein